MATKKRDEQSIEAVRRSMATVPWERLAHAYHGASDAPANLEVFLSSTASTEKLDDAIHWMWSSILHQGSIYSASILIDLLAAWPEHPAAASILRGVHTIMDAIPRIDAGYDEECGVPPQQNRDGEPVYEAWVGTPVPAETIGAADRKQYFQASIVTKRQLQALVRHSIPVIRASLSHSDGATRTAAVAAGLGALQVVPEDATSLAELAHVIGNPQFDPGAWISAAMILGDLGQHFSTLLEHPDRRMRLAASMSPSTANDPRSVAELASALSEPEWLEAAFPSGAAHLEWNVRLHVLTALLGRVKAGDAESSVVEAICTMIDKRAGRYTVDMEWGRVLHWAFAERIVSLPHAGQTAPLPDALTPTQSAILKALCDKAEFWDPRDGNAGLAFKRVQLPFDRVRLRRLTGDRKRLGFWSLFRRQ